MITTSLGLKKPENTDSADLGVFIGDNMDTIETLFNTQLANYSSYASVKDVAVYTVVDFKRSDATLYLNSTLSNKDVNGYFQTCTLKYYDTIGTTIIKTVVWTFAYDVDGNIITKVVA